MKNSFTITIEFSFKGETFALEADVDLDECMEKMGAIPDLHDLVAKRNSIDSYSYQYEVLTAEELQFSAVRGFAAEYISANEFDAEGFAARWREEQATRIVTEIAMRVMNIADIAAQPELKRALLEAYYAGRSA